MLRDNLSGIHCDSMERPLIAIIGDASKATNPDVAKRAGRELGAELEKKSCRILAFSSSPDFIEWEAVQGYQSNAKKVPGIHRSAISTKPSLQVSWRKT
jgi:hypothetical protein